ncbi:MAG: hypothetical protein AAGI71_13385 [Bacteroidota bacterium]
MTFATRIAWWGLLGLAIGISPSVGQTAPAALTETASPAASSVLEDAFVRAQGKAGLDQLYNMRFEEAATAFAEIDRRHPRHPIGPFLMALNTWWTILSDYADTSNDDDFFDQMEEVIQRSDRLLNADPDHFDARFFKGAALGFRGRLRANRGQWFRASRDGLQAMDYVLGVAEDNPDNPDYVFGKGLYDYYAEAVPDKYPFVRPVMGLFPDGNKDAGLEALERTAREGYYIQTEAVYFLLQIYYLFERNYENSLEHVTWLRERHPGNAFFHGFEGRVYASFGRWKQATAVFDDILVRYLARQPGYTDALAEQALYFKARGLMIARDYEEALAELIKLEALTARTDNDTFFKVNGRLRQGMCYDALGQRDLATLRYREVLRMDEQGSAQERARRYLERPYRR